MINWVLWHFVKKEFAQLRRDPRMLWIAVCAPIIQLIIFGYIATLEVKHVSTAVLDENRSFYSRTYLESLKNSGYFDVNYQAKSLKELKELIDGGQVKVAFYLPRDFSKKIVRKQPVTVQAIIDGENSSSATIIQGYINQINLQNLYRYYPYLASFNPFSLETRVFFNPELKSVYFMIPAIFALILMIESMTLTSFSIVKEKEKGTMEQLMVTPIRPYELILGKLIPTSIIALLDNLLVFFVATLWFKVPVRGSILLFFGLGAIFLATGLGLGIFISTISQNQRQAMMSAIFVLSPSMILSGFIFPIANMPRLIQAITYLIPARYFLVIVRGIFLKGIGINFLWKEALSLIIFGSIVLGLSIARFRKKIE
ncbi:MAG: ABC transporter permease [Candidatus Margulisiibacteriota bacterium]